MDGPLVPGKDAQVDAIQVHLLKTESHQCVEHIESQAAVPHLWQADKEPNLGPRVSSVYVAKAGTADVLAFELDGKGAEAWVPQHVLVPSFLLCQ